MANYFSNLSSTSTQSRFLSNKDKDSSQSSSTTVVATSTTTTGSALSGVTPPPPARVPSKHFSTTLPDEQKGASVREKSPAASSAGLPTLSVHPLRSTYVRPLLPLRTARS